MSLQAVKYSPGKLEVLNQLLLPHETRYEDASTADQGWFQIRTMKVRGAPAIAIVGALSLAAELFHLKNSQKFKETSELLLFIRERWEHLKTSRPTAVNLFDAAKKLVQLVERELVEHPDAAVDDVIDLYLRHSEMMMQKDIEDNRNIGKHGAEAILQYVKDHSATPPLGRKRSKLSETPEQPQETGKADLHVLTICNTGSLATAGYGTALGVIRALHEGGHLAHAYCLETRPFNQGSRLTAYELVHEKIPATLITDSMASALMKQKKISAIVVGADRVAGNGDTANKIGTYQLAISAQYHNVPFFVCAPVTSIDTSLASGDEIPIEERKAEELTQVTGAALTSDGQFESPLRLTTVQVAVKGINVWNPAFDVTPAALIEGIVTEKGVISKKRGDSKFRVAEFTKKH